MNHNQPPITDSPEVPASEEALALLRERVGTFVQAHGPTVNFPESTHIIDTGVEPPRPLITGEDAPTVYLTFPGPALTALAPEAVKRLQVDMLTLSKGTPTYEYIGDGPIPLNPRDIDEDDIYDAYLGGSGVSIIKPPDAPVRSTSYKLGDNGEFARESMPHEGDPWPVPSQDPSQISTQECADVNAILDGLDGLAESELDAIIQVGASSTSQRTWLSE
jgi:hypothetical protein